MAKKYYVLDTNILLESPDAVYGFQDNIVVVPATVLQELDRHKRDNGETGYNARESIRILEEVVAEDVRQVVTNRDFIESFGNTVSPADIINSRPRKGMTIGDAAEKEKKKGEGVITPESLLKMDDEALNDYYNENYSDFWDSEDNPLNGHLAFEAIAYRKWEKELFCSGYALRNGGMLLLVKCKKGADELSPEYRFSNPDNMILRVVVDLITAYREKTDKWLSAIELPTPVILVSNDVSMRINATVNGITAQSYKNVRLDTEEFYTGRTERDCRSGSWKKYYDEVRLHGLAAIKPDDDDLHENEYVLLNGEAGSDLIAIYKQGCLHIVDPAKYHPMGVTPRNAAQIMALDALMAPVEEIPLVILEGPAGTAKTFLSTAAGIDQTIRLGKKREGTYSKVIITRNNVLSDADHGFLPGDLEDKMFPLMAPFYDNLERIFSIESENEDPADVRMQIDDLFDNGVVETSSMAYIRGRSLSNTFLILDECQNATRGQMLTLLTRAAEKCKIVIAGCVDQIDNSHLDKYNNGLSFAIERFKDSQMAAQVTFTDDECVRSPLAAEASRLLAGG